MTSILIVEDDNDINNLICNTLKAEGYQCERAFDGKEGADKIEQNRYDLLLLDIMLPEINGYELLDYVRRIGDTPVIIISAMGQVDERIRGLRMGADDYICKPFQIGELLARVETVLRRTQRMAERLEIEDVAIDPKSRTVTKAGEQVELTVKEFDLLYELMKNKNVALSRRRLYELVWQEEYTWETRTLDSHVQRLRKKLDWNEKIVTVFRIWLSSGGSRMKFFYKMFLGMTVILAVALGMIEYVTLSYSLEHAVKREQDSALSQHQMIKYSIETVILNMKSEDVDKELTDMMSQSAKSIVGDEGGMYLADDDGKRIYANSCNYEQKDIKVKDGTLTYSIVSKENTKDTGEKQSSRYIHVKSSFKLNDNRYILITESDITPVFDESKELRYRCSMYYIVILAVGMMVILILSWMITKPLAGLTATTKKFADGDYTARSDVKTKDEIGELAKAFNELAKNLESKVYELQMAAKKQEDFTANFAHELKTPMTSIIGYADTLYQKKMSEDEVHSAAGVILNEGMRLEALSFKLLELITLDKNDFRLEETRISEIIADCVETAHEAARKHNTEIVYSADEAWVWLEYDLFKTMLLNLIDNAVKSGGSKVDVSGRLISHSIYRIAVSDNGRGIPPEDIERITEAFYMVDKSRSRSEHGAGLGLALVSRIAKLHDTKIHYESESGKGTKVYFDMKAEALDEK